MKRLFAVAALVLLLAAPSWATPIDMPPADPHPGNPLKGVADWLWNAAHGDVELLPGLHYIYNHVTHRFEQVRPPVKVVRP